MEWWTILLIYSFSATFEGRGTRLEGTDTKQGFWLYLILWIWLGNYGDILHHHKTKLKGYNFQKFLIDWIRFFSKKCIPCLPPIIAWGELFTSVLLSALDYHLLQLCQSVRWKIICYFHLRSLKTRVVTSFYSCIHHFVFLLWNVNV